MRSLATVVGTLGIAALLHACGNKADSAGSGAAGSSTAAASPGPASCPAGSVVKDGACTVVVTPEKIAAVTQQQSRLDALATLLDQVDTIGAPIELFDGIRQLEPWQTLKARSARIAALEPVAATLDNAVKTLRTFRGSLGEASARLSNLQDELRELMNDSGEARKLENVRATVSAQLRTVIEPLGAQVQDTIQNALVPLTTQLSELSDVVVTGCTMAKLSGGGEKMKELCARSRDAFVKALAYVGDLKSRPAQLFTDVTSQLETQLDLLVDAETKKAVDAVQLKVAEALQLPLSGSASGSAGSGSAR
jgi:hypothetical protein